MVNLSNHEPAAFDRLRVSGKINHQSKSIGLLAVKARLPVSQLRFFQITAHRSEAYSVCAQRLDQRQQPASGFSQTYVVPETVSEGYIAHLWLLRVEFPRVKI